MALIRRVRVVWTGVAGSPAYSNFYAINGVQSPNAFAGAVRNTLVAMASSVVTPVQAEIEPDSPLIDSTNGEILGSDTVSQAPVSMTNTSDMLPRSTQVLVRLLTGTYANGRQIRGRFYIPYVGANLNTDGKLDPLTASQVNAFVFPLIAGSNGGWVVWSRSTGGVASVGAVDTWSEFAVLRSRRD